MIAGTNPIIFEKPPALLALEEYLLEHPVEPVVISYSGAKRVFDFLGSIIFLLLFFPLYALVALMVRMNSPGPIFYKSYRVGYLGQPIVFVKYRTMYVDAEKRLEALKGQNEREGPIFKMKNDPRVTSIGRVLRKLSLDELPQFINVFLGSMSMVGPRPAIPAEVIMYDERALQRLSVKPGITCYWQIMGRSNLSFDRWVDLDLKYIREMSLTTDVCILLRTPLAVIKGDGAY